MPLLQIADLAQPQQVLSPLFQRAQSLSQIYFDHVANSQDDSYQYLVNIHGGGTRSQGIHASEISKCLRALVYGIMGMERIADPQHADTNMLMRFRMGHAIHGMLQNDWHRIAAASNGLMKFQHDIKVSPELGGAASVWIIYTHCDGIITLCDEYGNELIRIGLEIKSISDSGFSKLKSPQKDHLEQTTVYMATLNLPLMWLLYYNKSSSNISTSFSPFLFKFDDKLWHNVLEIRFAQATHMAQTNQVPAGTEGLHCKWCPFTHACQPAILTQAARRAYTRR